MLELKDLNVALSDGSKQIIYGVNLTVLPGEIHAVMGPNGSGKSTLTHALMGHPKYEIISGEIILDGENINSLETYERARAGLFATMQYPVEIPGVPVGALMSSVHGDLEAEIQVQAKGLGIGDSFLKRGVNDEFSGGERKRMETLQLVLSKSKYAVLDEIDSGLDVDALKVIASRVMKLVNEEKLGVIAITHHDRIFSYLQPTHVHVFANGKIIKSGGIELANQLEEVGYESFINA
ncbi:MAG TPA: Fe-S cluster assembly ATPase SufC [Acidimicrobiia bacterium]|nr:Fe-S cluster assembly ATPase SufC [Acidimicrobiia bacterium]